MFRRVFAGRYYDVWQRPLGSERQLLQHLSLGVGRQPVAVPTCSDVRQLASVARSAGGQLRFVERPANIIFVPAEQAHPLAWTPSTTDGALLRLKGPGRIEGVIDVPAAGRYALSQEGSDTRGYRILVDGREVSNAPMEMNYPGVSQPVATVGLTQGPHRIELLRSGGSLKAGNGANNRILGPLGFTPADPGAIPVQTADPSQWRSLCGRSLDWIEAAR